MTKSVCAGIQYFLAIYYISSKFYYA